MPAPTSAFLSGPDDPVPGARLYAALSSAGLDPSDLGAVGRGRAVSCLPCLFSVDGTIYPKYQQNINHKASHIASSFQNYISLVLHFYLHKCFTNNG